MLLYRTTWQVSSAPSKCSDRTSAVRPNVWHLVTSADTWLDTRRLSNSLCRAAVCCCVQQKAIKQAEQPIQCTDLSYTRRLKAYTVAILSSPRGACWELHHVWDGFMSFCVSYEGRIGFSPDITFGCYYT